jgi:hypothetical protein
LNRKQCRAERARTRHLFAAPLEEFLDRGADGRPVDTAGEVVVGRFVDDVMRHTGGAIPAEAAAARRNQMRTELLNAQGAAEGLEPVATFDDLSDAALGEGRARLAAMLPRAKEMARDKQAAADDRVAAALRRNRVRLADLDAVVIHPAPAGQPAGWHADIVFARPVPELGNCIGTAVAKPCATREEAEQKGLALLAGLIAAMPARCDA